MKGMVADRMAPGDDFPDDVGMLHGIDAGDKKSCLCRIPVQQIQDLSCDRFGWAIVKSQRHKIFPGKAAADDRQVKTALRKKGSGNTKYNIKEGDGYREERTDEKGENSSGQKNYSGNLSGT